MLETLNMNCIPVGTAHIRRKKEKEKYEGREEEVEKEHRTRTETLYVIL